MLIAAPGDALPHVLLGLAGVALMGQPLQVLPAVVGGVVVDVIHVSGRAMAATGAQGLLP